MNRRDRQLICPECGAELPLDAPQGKCLKCLFRLAAPEFAQAGIPTTAGEPDLIGLERAHKPVQVVTGPEKVAASGESEARAKIANLGQLISQPIDTTSGSAGSRAFGDYELLEEIARGGMGIVYRARQISLDREVAIKMLLFGSLSSPDFVRRFRGEAAAAGCLQHPNIVRIHEVGLHQGQHYIAMDFIAGQSLSEMAAHQPLAPREAARYLKKVAEAIQYAHSRGIIHRDLKPSNIIVDLGGEPHVTDF